MSQQEEQSQRESEEMLYRRATFGKQVSDFFNSDIGRYLMARADEEVVVAIRKFRDCDTSNVELVRKLQNDINMADNFKNWLSESVMDGLHAIEMIDERGQT